MELLQYLQIIKKRLLMIAIISIIFIGAAVLYTRFMTSPFYVASTTIIIGNDSNNLNTGQSSSTSYSQLLLYEKLVKTYQELAKSRTVSALVVDELDLDMMPENIVSMISTSSSKDTEIMKITVRNSDPKLAMDIANETAKALKQKGIDLNMGDNVFILEDALLPETPSGPNLRLNIMISFFMGIMVSLGIAFLLEYLDNTVKSQEDAENITGIPVIGTIPFIGK